MSNFKTVKGDLITLAKEGRFDAIIHGCNCFHIMGGGIARTISQEFPEAPKADIEYTRKGDYLKLGSVSVAYHKREIEATHDLIIFNAYTQFNISAGSGAYDPDVLVDYNAIKSVFRNIVRWKERKLRIGFPMIGAGLARGNWDIIKSFIEKEIEQPDNIHDWTYVQYDRWEKWL